MIRFASAVATAGSAPYRGGCRSGIETTSQEIGDETTDRAAAILSRDAALVARGAGMAESPASHDRGDLPRLGARHRRGGDAWLERDRGAGLPRRCATGLAHGASRRAQRERGRGIALLGWAGNGPAHRRRSRHRCFPARASRRRSIAVPPAALRRDTDHRATDATPRRAG